MMLCRDEKRGNYYKAVTDIKEGQILFEEDPVTVFPENIVFRNLDKEQKVETATCCGRPSCLKILPTGGLLCPTCKRVHFCSESCRDQFAHIHSRECELGLLWSEFTLGIRILASRIKFPFWMFPKPSLTEKTKTRMAKIIRERLLLRFGKEYTIPHMIEVLSKTLVLQINYKTFISRYPYATGIFHLASYIRISCDPNVYYYFRGSRIVIRAGRHIEKGEEISFCPDHNLVFCDKKIRGMAYSVGYSRECRCDRCTDPTLVERDHFYYMGNGRRLPPTEFVIRASKEMGKLFSAVDVNLVRKLEREMDEHHGPTNTAKHEMYSGMAACFFEREMYKEGLAFPLKLESYYRACHKEGLVSSVSHLIARARVLRFVLALSHYQTSSAIRRLKRSRGDAPIPAEGTLAKIAIVCSDSIGLYYELSALEMDIMIYPPLRRMGDVMKSAGLGNVKFDL